MSTRTRARPPSGPTTHRLPRLGFAGVGWIGRQRMQALAASGAGVIAALADPSDEARAVALDAAPGARAASSYEELLAHELDGVVIATPSAQHAEQARAALDAGLAVFCQKPLGRTGDETAQVVDAARRADRLLGVDMSYRETRALRAVRELVAGGELGAIHTLELTFHNAYGPDRDWFYDIARSGGGCVMDLGIHLVDAALWLLDFPPVRGVDARLFRDGRRVGHGEPVVEDAALATLDAGDAAVRIACSWRLHAGRDAVIGITAYGTRGGAALRNVDGSFYDFVAERYDGTSTTRLVEPPDDWGGRALTRWARRLADDRGYDAAIEEAVTVARVLDSLYGR